MRVPRDIAGRVLLALMAAVLLRYALWGLRGDPIARPPGGWPISGIHARIVGVLLLCSAIILGVLVWYGLE